MISKKVIVPFFIISLFATIATANNLDFSLKQRLPGERQIVFGWELMPWNDWLSRPSSGPLLVPDSLGRSKLEVFEARGAAIVDKPVTQFTEQYLHNLDTIRLLDPQDSHEIFPAGKSFAVQTTVPFPPSWSRLISVGKATNLLEAKSTDYLRLVSFFRYKSGDQITSSPAAMQTVERLDIVGRTPDVINIQGIVQINQIAQFGSNISFFYAVDGTHTLIVNYFALALKQKDLNLGTDISGLHLKGRSIPLGENPAINTNSGIGAGLPVYSFELFQEMIAGLRK